MKNPNYTRKLNGKFWCWHDWMPNGKVGFQWYDFNVPAKCNKCGKKTYVPGNKFAEWPDELISDGIIYT